MATNFERLGNQWRLSLNQLFGCRFICFRATTLDRHEFLRGWSTPCSLTHHGRIVREFRLLVELNVKISHADLSLIFLAQVLKAIQLFILDAIYFLRGIELLQASEGWLLMTIITVVILLGMIFCLFIALTVIFN